MILKDGMTAGYRINLSCGHKSYIIAADNESAWVEQKLAPIMQLKKKCGSEIIAKDKKCSLTIVMQKPEEETLRKVIRTLGWQGKEKPFDKFKYMAKNADNEQFTIFQVWTHPSGVNAVGGYGNSREFQKDLTDLEKNEIHVSMMRFILYPTYLKNLYSGGLPLHGALIEHNQKAVLLIASGGTGKTTCCCRLPASWSVLSDDMALIVRGQMDQQYQAAPLPTWSRLRYMREGDCKIRHSKRIWDTQSFFDLAAVFFLEQGERDEVIPVGAGEAALKIHTSYEQEEVNLVTDNAEVESSIVRKAFDNSCSLAKAVPAFTLRATLDGQFWKEIEQVI